jgi:hypothetical protein
VLLVLSELDREAIAGLYLVSLDFDLLGEDATFFFTHLDFISKKKNTIHKFPVILIEKSFS